MVAGLFHPLNIFILGLGGGFVMPLLYRLGKPWLTGGFFVALGGIVLVSGVSFFGLIEGGDTIEVLTAGALPPASINLRFGIWEGFFAFSVNMVALLGALHLWDRLRGNYAALLLYLILVMGIDGMVMTRDLFNLFVFLEIVSIATYGLLGLDRTPAALSAAFKYIIATVIASTFFLLGAVLLYYVSGTLNIDDLIAVRAQLNGPIAVTAVLLVFACLVIELKPFPANGWGLDVYETAPSGIAAMVSVGVSAGVFFALLKLLPLFEGQLGLIAISGGLTFLFSNLLALKQTKPQRVLGYSSIGQMGLLMLALSLLRQVGAEASIPLVVGGLFINHLFAKAGLFWLVGILKRHGDDAFAILSRSPLLIGLLGLFLVAIAGLPPFPAFWAKWELVMQLTIAGKPYWIALILTGSLLEAAYMFHWFVRALRPSDDEVKAGPDLVALFPLFCVAALLIAAGYAAASFSGAGSLWLFSPLIAGALFYAADRLPGRLKGILTLIVLALVGSWLASDAHGIAGLFAWLLLAGSFVIAAASLYRDDIRAGFYPMLVVLLLSIPALLRATTTLEFFYSWEIVTLSSCFLIAKCRNAGPHVLTFLLFSLLSAFCLLAGFAEVAALDGSIQLSALIRSGPDASRAFVLLAAGFLIKAGAIGVHVWLPGAYTEAEDDVTAMLSAVVSKVSMFGLLICTYLTIRSEVGLELAHVMAWIGMLTTIAGALMAVRQNDFKRLLAFSSMSQLGYIVTAIALMSHLGWVTALYLVANHMLVKGILFLALAGIIMRTGTRNFAETGGLARAMPFTFATVLIAIVSMSGLPPLMGFGGKWLLLSAMTDKGWYGLAVCGVLATFVGFLYMARIVGGLFFGPRRAEQADVVEAPLLLLLPQFVLVIGIVILSFFPKLLIEPVSAAIDPQFASTLVWGGMSLESIYGFWNPTPVVLVVLAVVAVLFAIVVLFYRSRRRQAESLSGFFSFYRPIFGRALPPIAQIFWRGVSHGALAAAAKIRLVYTGNAQTYALYVFGYFLVLYFASTGFGGGALR
ncbi:Formate hydrogenlyase subunit 3/Multisubunit Na+/H+ antiporter, MnhD subunit [Paraburkholderia fungorum]|uniref:Formate hydrogenlyase subunit 3/Multisubunit Na+/H+ antiporter, MnhD subunit n=1 Tax=Paraburkholderia fungorum TaxID=134537 RepID=A0A1H1JM08_9BURK|nr:proton-conducting transporter membrane subunit [Paraburkholderia fungorum]SDR50467.1 Formate hydrogenlyase subunit 3/Multisubunit Na+/H+ antiporter, MnhD subunit [Paraburkholderia fungorum]